MAGAVTGREVYLSIHDAETVGEMRQRILEAATEYFPDVSRVVPSIRLDGIPFDGLRILLREEI